MNPAEWSGDRIIAAIIVGSCTLTAALIKAYVEMRSARAGADTNGKAKGKSKGKRKKQGKLAPWAKVKSLATAVIVAGGVTFAALITGGIMETPNPAALLRAATGPAGGLSAEGDAAAEPAPYAEWLKTEGTTIYYNAAEYLPGGCPGEPTAHGSWAGGLDGGVPANCVDAGWLAFDIAPLADRGRVLPRITYCVTFRGSESAWGEHATVGAPGFDAVAVPASRLHAGRAIGFRFQSGEPFDRVVLTREFPRAAC